MNIKFFDADNFDHAGLGDFTFEIVPAAGDIVDIHGSYFKVVQRVFKDGEILIDVLKIDISDNYVSFSRLL